MKCFRFGVFLTLLLLVPVFALSAHASDIQYSFTAFGTTATFTLPSNPTPDYVDPGMNYFQIDNVSINLASMGTYTTDLAFFTDADGGGIGGGPNLEDQLLGPQLFSGSLTAPTLLTGAFDLSGFITPDVDGPVAVSGTLYATVPPVPEPSSIVLMLTGLLGVAGFAFRKRFFASADPAAV